MGQGVQSWTKLRRLAHRMTLNLQGLHMELHVYHHFPASPPDPRIDQVIDLLHNVIAKENKIMATLTDLQNSVAAQTTVESSIVTLLDGIAQQLRDAQANNDPAAIQAVIDQIDSNTKAMSEAVTRNTPAAP
jgi:ubiquitin-protein ligase